jgi:hypothetical protein
METKQKNMRKLQIIDKFVLNYFKDMNKSFIFAATYRLKTQFTLGHRSDSFALFLFLNNGHHKNEKHITGNKAKKRNRRGYRQEKRPKRIQYVYVAKFLQVVFDGASGL